MRYKPPTDPWRDEPPTRARNAEDGPFASILVARLRELLDGREELLPPGVTNREVYRRQAAKLLAQLTTNEVSVNRLVTAGSTIRVDEPSTPTRERTMTKYKPTQDPFAENDSPRPAVPADGSDTTAQRFAPTRDAWADNQEDGETEEGGEPSPLTEGEVRHLLRQSVLEFAAELRRKFDGLEVAEEAEPLLETVQEIRSLADSLRDNQRAERSGGQFMPPPSDQ